VVGHITPEATEGGLLALVQDDDRITIDIQKNTLNCMLTEEEITKRKRDWKAPESPVTKGLLYRYRKTVQDASQGCVTDA